MAPKPGEMLHLRGNALNAGDPVALPLTQSSMYHLPGAPDGLATYGRVDNPTWVHLEHVLAHLEDAPCLVFPSGMGAISAALFATIKAGSRILIPSDGYYVTRVLADRFLSGLGVSVTERPTTAFAEGGFDGFDVVFVESPSNPGLDMMDLPAIAQAVRAAGGITIADNTTMTPLGQRPLDLGVDVVVASDTKAMAGHSDLLMGHVSSRNPQIMERVEEWRKVSGAIPGPHEAWLLHRGLETLDVRFDRMCASAQVLAERLADHPAVKTTRYPGLPSDPAHALAKAQTARFGFLLSITLDSEDKAETFINTCPMLRPATSFGGVHSSAERRARWGDDVDPAFIRLSVGCEPVEELWQAVNASLNAL
ncbi:MULTISPECIES: cystathionine gamma-lyase [unclassified Ruegeria]|uniref:cystathionine gamma-lyase n=1 Tax=unclassified Ruegeria TaxID=2625375 RepID=UPI001AD9ABF5|nr:MULTISPECIES: cystathionine gamma-lyase [unclassified Ruegeria]MBO9413159.1 cystathionine gamma-lyase [Ruegeria sp. R8_1]MBO9416857.1 cystathionine gamma-lyase [Ruegeria sp. R8_2]